MAALDAADQHNTDAATCPTDRYDIVPRPMAFPARALASAVGRTGLSVAPMMEWTTRHYRYLARLLTRRTLLYTEMVVDSTLMHSAHARGYLRIHPCEHPVAAQVGGADPDTLARAARMMLEAGFDEINLNCGCPSDRVAGSGMFGAALMFHPARVRACVAAMRAAVEDRIPITVKCRLGADHMDSYEEFSDFLRIVADGGCQHFIVHARKCVLGGLSPKDNRTVPPLRYHWVQRAALEFPHLRISLNGGVQDLDGVDRLLRLRVSREYTAPPRQDVTPDEAHWSPSDEDDAQTVDPREGTQLAVADGRTPACCAPDDAPAAAPIDEADDVVDAPALGTLVDSGDDIGADAAKVLRRRRKQQMLARKKLGPRAAAELAVRGSDDGFPSEPLEQVWPGVVREDSAEPINAPAARHVLESVMVGRAAYNNMWLLADADRRVFGATNPGLSRREVMDRYLTYAETLMDSIPEPERDMGVFKPLEFVKPLVNLVTGCRGAAKFRNALMQRPGLTTMPLSELRAAVMDAAATLPSDFLDERP